MTSATTVLGRRALNRALLERQLLLNRHQISAVDTIEHLVGLQAQEPNDPYVALWTRLDGFQPAELADLLESRKVVRGTLFRGTIHLLTDRDYLALRPVLQPALERLLFRGTPFGRAAAGVDVAELLRVGRALLEERPLSGTELARLLGERWRQHDARALSYVVQYLLPLVQVTPRGVWGRSGQARRTTAQSWLGRELVMEDSPDRMIMRYLTAFGPAAPADIRTWSGLAATPDVIERLRPGLRMFRDERGRELLDVPDGPLPDADTPAPVRFLPEYDNVTLGHDDRSRIVSADDRKRVLALIESRGPHFGGLLVDGFGAGVWKLRRNQDRAALAVELLAPVKPSVESEIAEEGARLLQFLAGDLADREVRLTAL